MATATPKKSMPAQAPKPQQQTARQQGKPQAPIYTDFASI